jgi:hypothetical protein
MAKIVGGIMSSHVPAIGRAIARNLQGDPYWKPWFDGFPPVRDWLAEVKPDVAVVVYNDHGLNFFLDKMPTFAVGAAPEYRNADEGWGIPVVPPFKGDLDLSWHLIESLVRDEFDITTCQEMLVDHAFTLPMALLWPGQGAWPVRTVPVCVNTVQFPLPTAGRCWKLGEAIGRAVESWDSDARVVRSTSAPSPTTATAASPQTRVKPACRAASTTPPARFYVGAWASTIKWIKDFGGDAPRSRSTCTAATRARSAKDLAYDVGVLTYQYPSNGCLTRAPTPPRSTAR